jgi:parallel beta-helix repeat protein
MNSLNDNRASGNGSQGGEGGFGIGESNDTLVDNNAISNVGPGIQLDTDATGNHIHKNRALDNGSFDLEDDNPGCDANIWRNNIFGVANNPGCIN